MSKMFGALLLTLCLALPAFAGVDYNLCFNAIESDYDGEMTTEEFSAAFPDGDMSVFKSADTDGNGTVSHEEWEDFKAGQGFEEGEHHD